MHAGPAVKGEGAALARRRRSRSVAKLLPQRVPAKDRRLRRLFSPCRGEGANVSPQSRRGRAQPDT
ncbi:hypothetical protein DVDV_1280 [Desulfovibrio sp. DV]|nr:hypothetical protein DVDV_1280 [Desulfovibrio sp. DV]